MRGVVPTARLATVKSVSLGVAKVISGVISAPPKLRAAGVCVREVKARERQLCALSAGVKKVESSFSEMSPAALLAGVLSAEEGW